MEIKTTQNAAIIKFPSQKELDLTLANYANERNTLHQRNRKAKEYSDSLSFKAKIAKVLAEHQPVISSLITFLIGASAILSITYMFVDAFFIL